MKLAKITSKGQITMAIDNVREAFVGEAERLELKNEDDVVKFVKEYRKEKQKKLRIAN